MQYMSLPATPLFDKRIKQKAKQQQQNLTKIMNSNKKEEAVVVIFLAS